LAVENLNELFMTLQDEAICTLMKVVSLAEDEVYETIPISKGLCPSFPLMIATHESSLPMYSEPPFRGAELEVMLELGA